jgi:hypothetical protein
MATNAELYGVIQPRGDVVGRVLRPAGLGPMTSDYVKTATF